LLLILYITYYCTEILGCSDEILPDHMTSVVHPKQVQSATVDCNIPILITPDVVSSLTSEAVACCMPSTLWDTRRKELATYKQVNGHTYVPQQCPSNKPLGHWVMTQRTQYKLLQDGKKSLMTTERKKSLNELDFEWSLGGIRSNAFWDKRCKELATYKQVNGHTYVPQQCPSNKPLGHWVMTQRTQYKLFREHKTSTITTERIKSLNELDFDWSPGKEKKALLSTLWHTRRKELATYKQVNGHTNVSTLDATNKPLGTWVANQRTQYKLLQDGKKSLMTTERKKSLNELDFEWRHRKAIVTSWDDRLQELTIYKQANGSTNVPQQFPSNKPLGNWVNNQRQQYKLLQDGKKSLMTTERKKSLNELDFEWRLGGRAREFAANGKLPTL
jgi:hypothetical protein